MPDLALPALAGFIAAALVLPMAWGARKGWAWLRRDKLVSELRADNVQARRTIQSLHRQFGLTETTFMPLSVSQRLSRSDE